MGSATSAFNRHPENVLSRMRKDDFTSLSDWFGGRWDIECLEEVQGLGAYEKTLPLMTPIGVIDVEELLKDGGCSNHGRPGIDGRRPHLAFDGSNLLRSRAMPTLLTGKAAELVTVGPGSRIDRPSEGVVWQTSKGKIWNRGGFHPD